MLSHLKGTVFNVQESGVQVIVSPVSKDEARKFIVSHLNKENRPPVNLTLSVECEILTTHKGGLVDLQFLDTPDLYFESKYNEKTKAQNSTLRGIERFIFWATEGYKSRGDRDIYYIHEALVEQFSKPVENPITKISHMMRTSDPNMDVVTMSKIIEGGLNWLATLDIPDDVLNIIGRKMKDLWKAWYSWRYDNPKGDPLFQAEQTYDWDDYCKVHPVCELCGLPGREGDPLERMHIVSKGANLPAYEFPWNWLRSHHSHHHMQHSQGWHELIKLFPVIKNKIAKADVFAKGRGYDNE